jgi:dipicolinate synthase subunit B
MTKIGFGITASFCTFDKIYFQLQALKELGYEVIPIVTTPVITWDTRFGKADDVRNKIETITGNKIVYSVIEAEKFGPKDPLDLLVIAPATGDFLASLAGGITNNAVTMATKATLRNEKPIVIGVSTNDGLGTNGKNIMELYNRKNIYFIPFGQDDYEKKPTSLVAHYDMLIPTIEKALDNKQIQPVLKEYVKVKK